MKDSSKYLLRILIFLLMGSALAVSIHAQPLALQMAVAHNDKLQKEYGPYKLAIAEVFGERFKRQHEPYAERRRVCEWAGKWMECSYFRMSNASLITVAQKKKLEEILIDPCRHIVAPLPIPPVGLSDAQASSTERKKMHAFEKRKRLAELCKSGAFDGVAMRIANPSVDVGKAIEPDASKGEIGFEVKINHSKDAKYKGGSK